MDNPKFNLQNSVNGNGRIIKKNTFEKQLLDMAIQLLTHIEYCDDLDWRQDYEELMQQYYDLIGFKDH